MLPLCYAGHVANYVTAVAVVFLEPERTKIGKPSIDGLCGRTRVFGSPDLL